MSEWVSGTFRDSEGNPHSPEGVASAVFLEDGRTVEEVLLTLDTQGTALSTRIQSLTAAIDSVAAVSE